MGRLNFLLLALVIACALMLITTQHHSRRLIAEQERIVQKARQLEVEWNQLQLDQVELSRARTIDEVARKQLKMQPPSDAQQRYLNINLGKEGL